MTTTTEEKVRVFVTKWALTKGIIEVDATLSKSSKDLIYWQNPNSMFSEYVSGECVNWHRNRQMAIFRVEEMRIKKIAALKKQIAKLEKMVIK